MDRDRGGSRAEAAPPSSGTQARPPGLTDGEAPGRWRILALLAVAELLGMSLWFTASAVSPQLRALWQLSPAQAGWLTGAVQLGFVAGTALAALLNLADVIPSRRFFSLCAVLAAAANLALIAADGYGSALASRFCVGLFLAGVYPPAMKMVSTWFRSARGLAIGTVVGALTLGKATPYLLHAFPGLNWRGVVATASVGALLAAALVALFYRDGPYPFPRRRFSWAAIGEVVRDQPTRLAIGGYLGHMWELYAMWTLVSAFFHDLFSAHGRSPLAAASLSGLAGFSVIGSGAAGSVLAGRWADRLGRERVTIASMLVSGACALGIGWLLRAPVWLVVGLALVWGFAIVADSAQFSALVTELTPPAAVGTALSLQTSLGFLLTAGTIWMATQVSASHGWGPAFSLLAVGPVLGIVAMLRLKALRS